MRIIIFSMLIMAIVGGIATFLREGDFKISLFFKCILYSIIAVSTVPLFLNLISSSIVTSILNDKKIMNSEYLIFIGFCGLASIYASTFLDRMYARITEDLDKMKKELHKTDDEVKEIQNQFIEKDFDKNAIQQQLENKQKIAKNEAEDLVKILECILNSKYNFRTLKGIQKELKIDLKVLQKQLDELFNLGLIMKKIGKSGTTLFGITKEGLNILNE